MGMHATAGSMTVDEFYAYCDARPDIKKMELVGGEPVVNASANPLHERIVGNVTSALMRREEALDAVWFVTPGGGVRISEREMREPDVVVAADDGNLKARARDNILVAFEVLSPSTESEDTGPKLDAYTRLPSLTHYVVIAQDGVEVAVYARENGFKRHELKSLDDILRLPSLGVGLPLREIYRRTGL